MARAEGAMERGGGRTRVVRGEELNLKLTQAGGGMMLRVRWRMEPAGED